MQFVLHIFLLWNLITSKARTRNFLSVVSPCHNNLEPFSPTVLQSERESEMFRLRYTKENDRAKLKQNYFLKINHCFYLLLLQEKEG